MIEFCTVEIPKHLKQCTRCLKIMSVDKFYTNINNKSGFSCDCKKCNCEIKKSRRTPIIKEVLEPGYKRCNDCKEIKRVDEFYPHNQHKDGLSGKCKSCELLYQKNLKNKPKKDKEILQDGYRRCNTCLEVKEFVFFRGNENTCKCCWSKINSDRRKNQTINNKKQKRNRDAVILLESKKCSCCGIEKQLDQFHKEKTIDGRAYICKECKRNRRKEQRKLKKLNLQHIQPPATQTCRVCNIVKPITEYHKLSSSIIGYNNVCISCINEKKSHTTRDRKKERKSEAERMKNDSEFRIKKLVRASIRNCFKNIGKKKELPTAKYGIDFVEIYKHVGEIPGKKYELDHIIPLVAFDFNNLEHIKLSHIPENLRWIPKKDNIDKSDKIYWSLISKNDKLLEVAKVLNITEQYDGMNARELKGT